jgi:hypothetical protein
MKRWQKVIAASMASLVFVSTTALTAVEAGAALKEVKQLTVQQGPLRGAVVNSEGKGLAKAVVDVRDSKGEIVGGGVTKADGSFCLASIPAGEYVLSVNGDFTYALHIAKDAEAKSVALVVPSQAPYSAGQEEVGGIPTAALVAGGVALVGVAVVLLSDSDDDCE